MRRAKGFISQQMRQPEAAPGNSSEFLRDIFLGRNPAMGLLVGGRVMSKLSSDARNGKAKYIAGLILPSSVHGAQNTP
jgi:hypothetical protein